MFIHLFLLHLRSVQSAWIAMVNLICIGLGKPSICSVNIMSCIYHLSQHWIGLIKNIQARPVDHCSSHQPLFDPCTFSTLPPSSSLLVYCTCGFCRGWWNIRVCNCAGGSWRSRSDNWQTLNQLYCEPAVAIPEKLYDWNEGEVSSWFGAHSNWSKRDCRWLDWKFLINWKVKVMIFFKQR